MKKKRLFRLPDKDSWVYGLFLGLVVPLIAFGLLYGLFLLLETQDWVSAKGFRPRFRERTLGIIAIGLNALLLNYYQKRYCTNTMRGIAVITFFLVATWMALFSKYLF